MSRLPKEPDAFIPQRSEEGSSKSEVGESLPLTSFDDFDRSEVIACRNGDCGVHAQAVVQQHADKIKAILHTNLPIGSAPPRAEGSCAPRASLMVTRNVSLLSLSRACGLAVTDIIGFRS